MKTRLLIILAALLVGSGAFAQSNDTPLKGDVNGDGIIDISDYIGVANIILTGKP